ncbi:ScyD/ScyE family protein [Microbacterium sp. zg.B48]|uniref:ScyD/ScyE family protein n=1 Tax=unclassified Microbacterium TaxID=2609290 RepID=UPI00214C6EEE|nr:MULTISPECIES: ScyD/ScyE family protein [unclassified Microbacterium]MCR2764131.1 ScyD/ScyE family protein [Microbacterium sp. zg.B48]MCR2809002.1 ScyD/ScyE family protein [Microbacterium sp. zg.B185]WIM18587.1 ScyD/ScyE family protein [Microbacterium sp. zg-B185]
MTTRRTLRAGTAVAALAVSMLFAPTVASATTQSDEERTGGGPVVSLIASGMQGTIGSTIGPDGALYVAEGKAGQITRVDVRTGEKTAYATGLPITVLPLGGAIDIAFVGRTAYVLVTTVGDDVPGDTTNDVDGIYRVDDADSFTVIADIGEWSKQNPPPPDIDFFLARGVQYAMQPIWGGFLVTDGHHNRVVKVSMSGEITTVEQFANIVPTGITALGPLVFMAEAGPVPHDPSTGKVVAFGLWNPEPRDVASGYSLITDVALGACGLYAVSQGDSPGVVPEGSPALPDSGELLKVNHDGTFSVVADGLDLPTSVAFARDTAYVLTLNGEVWKVDDVSSAGQRHRWAGCFGNGYFGAW